MPSDKKHWAKGDHIAFLLLLPLMILGYMCLYIGEYNIAYFFTSGSIVLWFFALIYDLREDD